MPHKHGRRIKRKTQQQEEHANAEESFKKAPKSFVLNRYRVDQNIKELISDMRKVLYPNTALKLNLNSKSSLKDIVQTANSFQVTNLVFFKQRQKNKLDQLVMKIAKLPKGPTFNFKVLSFKNSETCQGKDINVLNLKSLQPPILITNKKLSKTPQVADCIKNLFPAVDPLKTIPKNCKRVCLFSRNSKNVYSFRHYLIKTQPSGINRAVKRIIKNDSRLNSMNFGRYEDISQLILENEGYQTESEGEVVGRMEIKDKEKISIRLVELGPRLDLKLYKIQSGFCQGEQIEIKKIKKQLKKKKGQENQEEEEKEDQNEEEAEETSQKEKENDSEDENSASEEQSHSEEETPASEEQNNSEDEDEDEDEETSSQREDNSLQAESSSNEESSSKDEKPLPKKVKTQKKQNGDEKSFQEIEEEEVSKVRKKRKLNVQFLDSKKSE